MSDGTNNGWNEYKPSKAVWFWSCAGAVVLTMIVGFTWGGWVTGGTADERVATATEDAVAELAANICVHRYLNASDAGTKLTALKETDSWERDTILEEEGWVTFASMEEPVDGAAEICADLLAEAELPAMAAVESDEMTETEIAN